MCHQRELLAPLRLDAGRVVSSDRLMEELCARGDRHAVATGAGDPRGGITGSGRASYVA